MIAPWIYFGCFIVSIGGIFPAELALRAGFKRTAAFFLLAMLLGSLVIVGRGVVVTVAGEMSIWPFIPCAISGFMSLVSASFLRRLLAVRP